MIIQNYIKCQSCLQCKRIDHKFDGKCIITDGLTPILKEIKEEDANVVGLPIYWGLVSAAIHPVLEMMWFSNKYRPSVHGKNMKVSFVLTMNVDKKSKIIRNFDMIYLDIDQNCKDSREIFPLELEKAFELGKRLVS